MYPDHLRYTEEHEWIDPRDPGRARVGITQFAQEQLGDIVFVELPAAGSEYGPGAPFGVVESVKTVSDLFMPVAGRVIEVNPALEKEPEKVNSSPHEDGWMLVLEVSDPSALEGLMTHEQYAAHLEKSGGGH